MKSVIHDYQDIIMILYGSPKNMHYSNINFYKKKKQLFDK